MRVLGPWLQSHEVDHVHERGSKCPARTSRSRVTAARVSSVGTSPAQAMTTSGSSSASLCSPIANARVDRAVANSGFDIEPLPLGLLTGDDQVDVVRLRRQWSATDSRQCCIGRQIDAHDVGLFTRDMIDEARILVGEAVVILPPDVRREQVVQRGNRLPPRELFCSPSATSHAD